MNRPHRFIALALTGALGIGLMAPVAARASEEGKRNTAIALGAASLGLLLTQRNKVPGIIAGVGAAYAYSQYDQAVRDRHRREDYYGYDRYRRDHNYDSNNWNRQDRYRHNDDSNGWNYQDHYRQNDDYRYDRDRRDHSDFRDDHYRRDYRDNGGDYHRRNDNARYHHAWR